MHDFTQAFALAFHLMLSADAGGAISASPSRLISAALFNNFLPPSNSGIEPPDDPVAILTLQCEFLAARLKYEERQFHETQNSITVQASYHRDRVGPAPPEQAFANLQRFQQNVVKFREQLQAKQAELHEVRGPTPAEQFAERRSRERATAHQAINRAASIQI